MSANPAPNRSASERPPTPYSGSELVTSDRLALNAPASGVSGSKVSSRKKCHFSVTLGGCCCANAHPIKSSVMLSRNAICQAGTAIGLPM